MEPEVISLQINILHIGLFFRIIVAGILRREWVGAKRGVSGAAEVILLYARRITAVIMLAAIIGEGRHIDVAELTIPLEEPLIGLDAVILQRARSLGMIILHQQAHAGVLVETRLHRRAGVKRAEGAIRRLDVAAERVLQFEGLHR